MSSDVGDLLQSLTANIQRLEARVAELERQESPAKAVQSITGATTQNQVDSIVTALVALGLAEDNRKWHKVQHGYA